MLLCKRLAVITKSEKITSFAVLVFSSNKHRIRTNHAKHFSCCHLLAFDVMSNTLSTMQVKPAVTKPGYRPGPSDWSIRQIECI